MTIIHRILITVLIVGMLGAIGAVAYYSFGEGIRSFHGSFESDDLQTVYSYQKTIMQEAQDVGAKVKSSDITLESPPEYSFIVVLPDQGGVFSGHNYTFDYGKAEGAEWTAKYAVIGIWVFLSAVILFLSALIWTIGGTKEKSEQDGEIVT